MQTVIIIIVILLVAIFGFSTGTNSENRYKKDNFKDTKINKLTQYKQYPTFRTSKDKKNKHVSFSDNVIERSYDVKSGKVSKDKVIKINDKLILSK